MKRLTSLAAALSIALGAAVPASAAELERVAEFTGAMPTGVTVTETGRIFVNFPRWGDDVPYTVAELKDGKPVAYPDADFNRADARDPKRGLVSVQSVVADGQGRVWLLDTAAPKFAAPLPGGPKLVAVDLKTNKVVKTVVFPADVILPTTYVNDMRFDLRTGAGVAYVTDSSLSGPGAIIVLDLATGKAVRRLSGHASTSADAGFAPVVEGKPFQQRGADGKTAPFKVASDGIALSPDGQTLYYSALSSRRLFAVPTRLLRDPAVTEAELAAAVRDLGEKGASDGLEADARGNVYGGDYEHNALRRLAPGGTWQTIAQGPELLWPDTLSVGPDGYLYVIANQLHRQANFNGGRDLRVKPYRLLRVKIDAAPAPTR